jgi:hypothetical protein
MVMMLVIETLKLKLNKKKDLKFGANVGTELELMLDKK